MCVILLAPKGTDKKSEFLYNAIRTGAITNTDGIGIMYKEGDAIYVDKGYKDAEETIEALNNLSLSNEFGELAIHLRIGNKGHVNSQMCHPFICSTDDDETMLLHTNTNKPTLMHNGTFIGLDLPTGKSDTFVFANKIMSDTNVQNLFHSNTELFKDIVKSTLGLSRLLVFYPDERDHVKIGNWIEDNGYYFSNETYKNSRLRNVGGVETAVPSTKNSGSKKSSNKSRATYNLSERCNLATALLLTAPKENSDEYDNLFSHLNDNPIAGNTFMGYGKRLVREDFLSTGPFASQSIISTKFTDLAGYDYVSYKGLFRNMYDPRKLGDLITIEPFINKYNYKYFTLQAKVSDEALGINENMLYSISNILYQDTTQTSLALVNRAVGAVMHDSIYMDINELPLYFSITPKHNDVAKGIFKAYLDMVSVFNDYKKSVNKLAKQVKGKNDLEIMTCGNKAGYHFPAVVVKWFIYEVKKYQGEPIQRIRKLLNEKN